MPETRAQKVARLQREIDNAEMEASAAIRRAEARREKLHQMKTRPPEPEWQAFQTQVKFVNTSVRYTFVFLKTPAGYYTTGSGRNAVFRTWDNVLDWLDSDDIESHTGLEALALTGEILYPKREQAEFGL